jgi:hypothetical protein
MLRRVKMAAKVYTREGIDSVHEGLNRRQKKPVIVEATAQVGFVRVVGNAVSIQLGHELAGN